MNTGLPELKYYPHTAIDRIRWDKCIQNSANGLVYALSWYLDTVTNDKWDALISHDYSWVMPLPLKRKMGITYLPTPRWVQQLGIFGPGPFSSELTDHFCKHVAANVRLIEYQINYANPAPSLPDFTLRTRTNLVMELPADRSTLWERMNENTQRNIKKAEKSALSLSTASIRNIINLFQENRGNELPDWNEQAYRMLEQLYNVSMMRGCGQPLGAYNASGELVAGIFVLQWNGRATFIFSGNSEEGKKTGALPALLHKYMIEAPASITIFDFEGSDDTGLARFYEGFGASPANYVHLRQNRLPFYLRWLKS